MGRNDVPSQAVADAAGPHPAGALAGIAELLGGETAQSRRFLGGLIAGALVGAVIAGGSLRRRRSGGRPGAGDTVS